MFIYSYYLHHNNKTNNTTSRHKADLCRCTSLRIGGLFDDSDAVGKTEGVLLFTSMYGKPGKCMEVSSKQVLSSER